MADHTRPTLEELNESMQRNLEEFEKLEQQEDPSFTQDTPEELQEELQEELAQEVEEAIEESEPADDLIIEEEEIELEEEPIKPQVKPEVKRQQTPEERARQSASEAQYLASSKKALEEQIDEAYMLDEPTEDDLRAEYTDWDVLSDFERKQAKKTLHNDMILKRIRQIRQDARESENAIREFVKKVDTFSIHPDTLKKYPALEGKQDQLAKFAARKDRITFDLDDLVALFLVKTAKPEVKHKGKMFETGTGGSKESPKQPSDKITLSEASILMKTNYKKYKEYLMNDKIDYSSID